MALGSLAAHLTASGLGSLSASMKKKKLEKKVNSGEIDIDDLLWLGSYYFSKKDYFKAESYANKALEIDANNYSTKNTLFNIFFAKGDYSNAIEMAESLIENGNDLAIHYFNLGYCNFKKGDNESAEKNRLKASEIDSAFKSQKYK